VEQTLTSEQGCITNAGFGFKVRELMKPCCQLHFSVSEYDAQSYERTSAQETLNVSRPLPLMIAQRPSDHPCVSDPWANSTSSEITIPIITLQIKLFFSTGTSLRFTALLRMASVARGESSS
jgi:hypothetical protein